MTAPRAQDVERFRDAVRAHFGFAYEDTSRPQLAAVLGRRVTASHGETAHYLDLLEQSPAEAELQALADELTINETYFFRNVEQLRAFEDVVVAACAREGRPLRVLSAGCSSGEEPYSLAISAVGRLPAARISILGVDVSRTMLERARRARYPKWSLRATPADVAEKWFRVDGRDFVLADEARERVRFEETNLLSPRPGLFAPAAYDVVFCRNVLMYFGREEARTIVARFASSLTPGGFLFLGHAETLRGWSDAFAIEQSHATFYYRLLAPDQRPASRPPDAPASSSSPAAAPVPSTDGRWVDAIRGASARIDSLAEGRTPPAAPAAPAFRLEPIVELLERERFAEAWALFEARPASTANDPEVLLLGAVLATNRSDAAQAERLCRELLSLDSTHAGAHYLYALCKEGAGDHAAAREHDRTALRLEPRFAMPQLHLGLLARRAGELPEARRELTAARSLLLLDDTARISRFGGGFGRSALLRLCEAELVACGGAS